MADVTTPLRVGVIGTGALGRHHVRILSELEEAELVGIVDLRPDIAEQLAGDHGTRAFPSVDDLAEQIEAAVVAVPTVDHHRVGLPLLERGIDTLIEKPIATSLEEADDLLKAAAGRVFAVGHVEFYNPAVQKLLAVGGGAGYAEIQRLARFTPRSLDVDVVLDLMIHDLQILHAIDPSPVAEIRATGIRVLTDTIDIANARIELESGCVANLTASRVSAERIRKLRVFLRRSYLSLDYQEQSMHGYELVEGEDERSIRPLDLDVVPEEPLRVELRHFLDVCRGGSLPIVSGADGRRALATARGVLEAIDRPAEAKVGRGTVVEGGRPS